MSDFFFYRIVSRISFHHDTLAVAEDNASQMKVQNQLRNGDSCRTGAVHHNLQIAPFLSYHLQGIQNCRTGNDGGSVLIVVEDRNITLLHQLSLDFKASRCADVLQIDAAKALGNPIDGLHNFVHIFGIHAQRDGIHVSETLEQRTFSFHYRHCGAGTDIPQSQNGGTVGDYRYQVTLSGVFIGQVFVFPDFQARLRNPRCVSNRQILIVLNRRSQRDIQLSSPLTMLLQCHCSVVHAPFSSCPGFQSIIQKKRIDATASLSVYHI